MLYIMNCMKKFIQCNIQSTVSIGINYITVSAISNSIYYSK